MKNLYRLQTFLAGVFLLLALPLAFAQLSDPVIVNVKSSGSSFTDQFAASTDYTYGIVQDVSPQTGAASIAPGGVDNTLKVTFTPNTGITGTTDLIVTYFTLSAPMHPVTKWYRFHIAGDVVLTSDDRYVIDKGVVDAAFPVLENDTATAGVFSVSRITTINTGSASVTPSGDTILFTPDPDFEGETWIQYLACDTAGHCAPGNIHVLVRDADQLDDHLSFRKFLLNREPLDVLTPFEGFGIDVSPAGGTLDSTGAYSWRYVADEGFTGNDTFQLSLTGFLTREYIVTVYQKAVNIQAKDDKFYVRPGLSITFNVLNNDLLDFDLVSNTSPVKGTLNTLGNGAFTYTPNPIFRGVDKFTYTSCFQDTVYCETATVLIHVTDLEPENAFTYRLQTSEDLPLAIDHPIAYTDFSYIINQHPSHGQLTYYDGVQSIALPCEEIDGFNMLVYVPDAGYAGEDHFEYYYCIHPSNLCYLVKVDVDVVAAPEPEACPCVVNCVWPGDADQDGRVDMNDLLVTGHNLGQTGPVRSYAAPTAWFGQHGENWPFSGNGADLRHADADGDGVVSVADTDVIDAYYDQTHDIVVKDVQQKLPYQFSLIPVQFSLDSGDVVILDVSIGTPNSPVIDLNGTKFTVNIPAAWMDSSSVDVIFHQNSWLANGSPFVSMGKVPYNGRIDGGISKADGKGSSGFGVIATVVFIIVDDIEGFKTDEGLIHIPVSLREGVVMGLDGTMYDIEGHEIVLTYNPHGRKENPYTLIVYPNPAQDVVNVHVNGKTEITAIEMFDMQGRIVPASHTIDGKRGVVHTGSLASGLYYIRTTHQHGVLVEAVTVIR